MVKKKKKSIKGTSLCGKLSTRIVQLQLGHSSLTCNHLPPALIQVRGNHVPHGYRRASQILQVVTGCTQSLKKNKNNFQQSQMSEL